MRYLLICLFINLLVIYYVFNLNHKHDVTQKPPVTFVTRGNTIFKIILVLFNQHHLSSIFEAVTDQAVVINTT